MRYRLTWLLLLVLLPLSTLIAENNTLPAIEKSDPSDAVYTPPELSPWTEWIKERHPEWQCVRNHHTFQCQWPGTIRYELTSSGATFLISTEILSTSSLPLPSAGGLFPRQVTVKSDSGNSVSAPLEYVDGQLSIRLPKGKFQISGSFQWKDLPPEIPVPSSYGVVDLSSPKELGELHSRRGPNSIWLEKKQNISTTDSLTLSVMRHVSDGSPLSIETLIRLRVSGGSRPLQILSALPASSEPVTLESPLPAQLSREGNISLQLLPGEYEVRAISLMQQPVTSIRVPTVNLESWPKEEVWSWQPDMGFRSVELSGGQALNADLTQLPPDWKSGATYVLSAGAELRLNEIRRGEQSQAPNRINLSRELWLDLEGSGATVSDKFNGTLSKDFRINALPETKVGRATVDSQPALVTLDPITKASGVELRNQNLNLEVVSRLEDARSFHSTGWDSEIDQLNLTLNIPPSWRLLHVAGAAQAYGSWVDSWSLLHIFVSILLVLSAFKLFGKTVSLLLGVSLVINHGEFLAPSILYVHLMLLGAWRLLTEGRSSIWRTLSQTLLAITFAAWSLQTLAFAKLQFTEVLFPQLQAGTRYRTILQELIALLEDSLLVWPMLLAVLALGLFMVRSIVKTPTLGKAILRTVLYGIAFILFISVLSGIYGTMSYQFARRNAYAPVPQAMRSEQSADNLEPSSAPYLSDSELGGGIDSRKKSFVAKSSQSTFSYQGKNLLSGPALPSWHWHSNYIQVATPVGKDHLLKFYLLSPAYSRIFSGLRALLSLSLIVFIFKALGYEVPKNKAVLTSTATATIVFCLAISSMFINTAQSFAEEPRKEILDELQNKLENKLCNKNECSTIESAAITSANNHFKIQLKVSSVGLSSVEIPGPLEVLTPTIVSVNQKSSSAMRRSDKGYLVVKTEPGENNIELEGNLPDAQAFTVQFPQQPLFVSVEAESWYVEGLNGSGFVQENLRFIKRATKDQGSTQLVADSTNVEGLHTWVNVLRQLTIGEQISVHTTVSRVGNISREVHVKIPLMPGEQITSGAASVENNQLQIGFAAGTRESSFSSALPYSEEFQLSAKPTSSVSEEWIVLCQPVVACNFSGLQATNSTLNGTRAFRWLPFPNEQVNVEVKSLTGLQGDFVTVDNLRHDVRWGANLLEGDLTAVVRATQQTTFNISAPADTSIRQTSLDGQAGRSSETGTDSSVLLSPGSHTIQLSYSKAWAPQWNESVPKLSLSAPANNISITVHPSTDRWLLWTGGLAWGPCVVFWAKLLLVVILSVFLQSYRVIPGSKFGAIFLGMGLSTIPIVLMIKPLLWLTALMLIPSSGAKLKSIPRWLRTTLFIGLSVVSLAMWYFIVQTGLVLQPPMLIAGNGSSSDSLIWYADHISGELPSPWVISAPIWIWRIVALLWSTWLVVALFGWLRSAVTILRSDFAVNPHEAKVESGSKIE